MSIFSTTKWSNKNWRKKSKIWLLNLVTFGGQKIKITQYQTLFLGGGGDGKEFFPYSNNKKTKVTIGTRIMQINLKIFVIRLAWGVLAIKNWVTKVGIKNMIHK